MCTFGQGQNRCKIYRILHNPRSPFRKAKVYHCGERAGTRNPVEYCDSTKSSVSRGSPMGSYPWVERGILRIRGIPCIFVEFYGIHGSYGISWNPVKVDPGSVGFKKLGIGIPGTPEGAADPSPDIQGTPPFFSKGESTGLCRFNGMLGLASPNIFFQG